MSTRKKKKIYDKFMLWHQCKPLQCEVFPLREALMLASSLDFYNSMLLHLAASIWDAAQTLFQRFYLNALQHSVVLKAWLLYSERSGVHLSKTYLDSNFVPT